MDPIAQDHHALKEESARAAAPLSLLLILGLGTDALCDPSDAFRVDGQSEGLRYDLGDLLKGTSMVRRLRIQLRNNEA